MLHFLRYGVNKTPHTSITFRRILLVCIKTVFCNSVIFVPIPMVFNLFSRALRGVPRAPTANGTTVTFIFHTFFSPLGRSKQVFLGLLNFLIVYSSVIGYSKVNYLAFMAFFIIENQVRPS